MKLKEQGQRAPAIEPLRPSVQGATHVVRNWTSGLSIAPIALDPAHWETRDEEAMRWLLMDAAKLQRGWH